jgi:AbrB family looped-hinge helix DNA binding protein
MTRVYEKGQVTLPKAVRDQAGIGVGDELVIEVRGREIVMRRAPSLLDLRLPRPRKSGVVLDSQEETDAAWEDHLVDEFGSRPAS